MNPTKRIRDIMTLQETYFPDNDPGDVNISVQDDSRLVYVTQDAYYRRKSAIGFGSTIEDAVADWSKKALKELRLELKMKEVLDRGSDDNQG